MNDTAIEIRPEGFASLTRHGRLYKREPGSDGNHRWLKRTSNGWKAVSDRRARRCERLYHHPEDVKPFRRFPRLDPGLKVKQPVYSTIFGTGNISAIRGWNITVAFGDQERQMLPEDLVTLSQAEFDWQACWLNGANRRLEQGKWLWIIKSLCRHGGWQAFLDKYGIPRSTAYDLIKRYQYETEWEAQHLTGNRSNGVTELDRQLKGQTADHDADERDGLVRKETEKRRGKSPTDHETYWSIRIKLPPEISDLCREQYKADGSKEYWRRAAYQFVDQDPDAAERTDNEDAGESDE